MGPDDVKIIDVGSDLQRRSGGTQTGSRSENHGDRFVWRSGSPNNGDQDRKRDQQELSMAFVLHERYGTRATTWIKLGPRRRDRHWGRTVLKMT